MKRSITVLSAPSNLGLMPPARGKEPGVRRLPEALKAAGLAARLRARDAGTVEAPSYAPQLHAETGIRNAPSIRRYTEQLADAVQELAGETTFLLVLGGDCSILLGAMLGLRRTGDHGLVFIDGHRDFQTPETSYTGGAAGMDLALATGRGPALLTRFDAFDRLVHDEAVAAVGYRDEEPEEADGLPVISDTAIRLLSLETLRHRGPGATASEALDVATAGGKRRFWVHLDVDVLDSDIMPAVDSPAPDGMTYDELTAFLVPLLQDEQAAGMDLTIYDPDRDPRGEIGRGLTDWLVKVLTEAIDAAG